MKLIQRIFIVLGFIVSLSTITLLYSHTAEAKLLVPQLKAKYPDLIVWKWPHKNPYRWNVYISLDKGASYITVDGYWMYGDARQFAPDGGGELTYIVGVDQFGKEITGHSNIVRPDDAPVPHKKILNNSAK